jgi:VWFA-related protein
MLLWGLPKQPAFGQTPTPATTESTNLHLQSSLVIVPALVQTRTGDLVFALQPSDFVITDNGVPQKITMDDETGGQPIALVVVIEVGGAGAREFDNDRYLPLYKMLEALVGAVPHKVAVVSFDSQARLVQPFTPSVDAAVAAISDLTPGCSRQHHMENCEAPGSTHDLSSADNGAAILDSLGFAVDLLRGQAPSYRRAVLLISETRDRGSHLQMDDAVRELSETNTTIYSVGFSTGKSEADHYAYRNLPGSHRYSNPPHGCMGKDPTPDPDGPQNKAVQAYDCLTQLAPPLALAKMLFVITADGLRRNVPREVAQLTGGEYFALTNAKSLEQSLARISNHLPNRYVFSFRPQSLGPGFHAISVSLPDHPDLNVTARTGYWAEMIDR